MEAVNKLEAQVEGDQDSGVAKKAEEVWHTIDEVSSHAFVSSRSPKTHRCRLLLLYRPHEMLSLSAALLCCLPPMVFSNCKRNKQTPCP